MNESYEEFKKTKLNEIELIIQKDESMDLKMLRIEKVLIGIYYQGAHDGLQLLNK